MKKWMYVMGISALAVVMLTGCSQKEFGRTDSSSDVPSETVNGVQDSPSQEETDIMKYERKYASGEFMMEDYQALAALYAERGSIRKQRDMLEQSYRLYEDNEAFKTLQDIAVNLEEEDAEIRAQAMLLYQNLEIPEYQNEAIHVIESREWFDTMMPKLGEGVRKYFLQENGSTKFLICVGYDENGTNFSNVWYLRDGGAQLILLNYSGGVVQMLETSLKEENYEGNFSLWVLDSTSGSILNEQGTFAKGIYSGEYTLKIYKNNAAGDPFDLWNNRENMEYASYTVKADEQGQGELEQFAVKLMSYPAIKAYEVEADKEIDSAETIPQPGAEEMQIRIFDGDIQLFQNGIWVSMGSVEQYMEKDPFRGYVKQNTQEGNELLGEKKGIDFDNLKLPASEKEQDKDKNKNNTTPQTPVKKPTAQSPTPQTPTPQKPAVTAPPAAPAPAPDDDDDDGGNDDGGSGNDSDSDGGSDNSGSDSGSDNGSNDGGGGAETDVEWTPDLM